MKAVQLDALDMQLIDLLGTDARISNRKIAAELGVTEGTVRGRIRRLQQDGLIAFTAIRGLEIADHSRLAFVRIQAEIEHVRRVAHEISLLPQVTERSMIAKEAEPEKFEGFMAVAENPEFTAHIFDAIARSPRLGELSGQTLIGAEIAGELGITDRGAERPSYREMLGSPRDKTPAAVY